MASVGLVLVAVGLLRSIIDPSGTERSWFAWVFGGGLFAVVMALGAAFVEEVVLFKWFHYKGRANYSATAAIEATTAGVEVSNELESGTSRPPSDAEFAQRLRFMAGDFALQAMLRPESGPLAGCRLHLYILDSDDQRLKATRERDHHLVWDVGKGVVGRAYELGEIQLAIGTECSDDTFGLTPSEQRRHATLREVAAVPVRDDEGTLLAILSASNRSDVSVLGTELGMNELIIRSFVAARLMIDLLKWQSIAADE
jgi:hypothetical protein